MKKQFILLALLCCSISLFAQFPEDYLDWRYTAVDGIYQEISVEDTASYANEMVVTTEDTTRFFIKEMYADGIYEVQVENEVNSNLWSMVGSFYFIHFRNNPFLYSFDEGILVWEGLDGGFYKQPY